MQTEDMEASAGEQLANLCSSWESSSWDELDWSRVKLLSIRDALEARQQELGQAQSAQCLACPKFVKHVGVLYTAPKAVLTVSSFLCAMMSG